MARQQRQQRRFAGARWTHECHKSTALRVAAVGPHVTPRRSEDLARRRLPAAGDGGRDVITPQARLRCLESEEGTPFAAY